MEIMNPSDKGDERVVERGKNLKENGSDESEGSVQLSDSILMYSNDPISASSHVYRGLLMSGVFGDQKIAVKYLPHNEQNVEEAKLLYELGSHPNVVTFFYADVHHKGPYPAMYIAMELCQTLNLHDRILKNKKDNVPFDHELSLLHAKQIALGVDFIHKRGIINRDLKPQNILISVDGKNLKVADFGLSKPLRHGRSMTRQSFRGAGTDGYRAPETYNSDVISLFSDIYSLALIFYFIWSYGCHPFGDDSDDWNSNIKKNRDRDLSQLRILNKERAKHLLGWMLQMVPKKRPTSDEILKHPTFTESSTMEDTSAGKEVLTNSIARKNLGSGKKETSSWRIEQSPRFMEEPSKLSQYHTSSIDSKRGQETDMNERESLEAILVEENCQELMKKSQYVQALLKLQDLVAQGRSEVSTKLMIAECNLRLGRDEIAKRFIDDVRHNIMTSEHHRIHEVKALIEQSLNDSNHVQAIILFPCLSWFYAQDELPRFTEMLTTLHSIHESMKYLVNQGGRSLIITLNIGFPSMFIMLEHIRSIKIEPQPKALSEAKFLGLIAVSYADINDPHQSLEYQFSALQVLESNLGQNAPKNRTHGALLNALGNTHRNLGNDGKAIEFYEKAIESKKQALDFDSELGRMESIQGTIDSLKNVKIKCRERNQSSS